MRATGLAALVCGFLCAANPGAAQTTSPTPSSPAEIEAVFLAGLGALNAGDARQAIVQFSAILARDPTLTRVRLELARAYFFAGEFGRARAEFLTVLSAGDLPDTARQNILRFIREIDARRGFEWAAEVGLTEVGETRDFDTDIIELDFGGGALPFTLNRSDESRLGVAYALEATFRGARELFASPTTQGSAFVTLSLTGEETTGSALDQTIAGLRAGVLRADALATYGAALESSALFEAGDHEETRLGFSLQAERRFAQGQTVFASLRAADINHQVNPLLDGDIVAASLGYQRPFGGRANWGAEVLFERQDVESDLENTRRYALRGFANIDVRGGFTLRPSLLFERREFVSPSPLFTADPDEESWEAALRIEKNDLFFAGGFSPFVTLRARRTSSGIDAFSYDENEIAFGLESRF